MHTAQQNEIQICAETGQVYMRPGIVYLGDITEDYNKIVIAQHKLAR